MPNFPHELESLRSSRYNLTIIQRGRRSPANQPYRATVARRWGPPE